MYFEQVPFLILRWICKIFGEWWVDIHLLYSKLYFIIIIFFKIYAAYIFYIITKLQFAYNVKKSNVFL